MKDQEYKIPAIVNNQGGFVLVASLMVLLILVVMGISATNTSVIESMVAGTDKAYKIAFYAADGGTEVGSEVIEHSLTCKDSLPGTVDPNGDGEDVLTINTPEVWLNDIEDVEDASFVPADLSSSAPVKLSVVYLYGRGAAGGSLQMLAGYEGKGKGAAGAGFSRYYGVTSSYAGNFQSNIKIELGWRHSSGQEGDCPY
ncbi:MAG: pilus assembly PilX N-terminal domain-containing protein [Desulfobulbaceae bacterium]|nr:pilus assembly PilX N-terminal domain-containing protein [Desulfobulbaceae bacterium]